MKVEKPRRNGKRARIRQAVFGGLVIVGDGQRGGNPAPEKKGGGEEQRGVGCGWSGSPGFGVELDEFGSKLPLGQWTWDGELTLRVYETTGC